MSSGAWYITLFDVDVQQVPAKQREEACIDDDQYDSYAMVGNDLYVESGLPGSCDGTRDGVTHTKVVGQEPGFLCDNPKSAMELTTVTCAECVQCQDHPEIAQYFPVDQKERAVMFKFAENVTAFEMTLAVTCEDCVFTGGRAFHLGTTSNVCENSTFYIDGSQYYDDDAGLRRDRRDLAKAATAAAPRAPRHLEEDVVLGHCPEWETCVYAYVAMSHGEVAHLLDEANETLSSWDDAAVATFVGDYLYEALVDDYGLDASAVAGFAAAPIANGTLLPTAAPSPAPSAAPRFGRSSYRGGADAASLATPLVVSLVVLFQIMCSAAALLSGMPLDARGWMQLELSILSANMDYAWTLEAVLEGAPAIYYAIACCILGIRFVACVAKIDLAIRKRLADIGFKLEMKELAGPGPYPYARSAYVSTLAATHTLDLARLMDIPKLEEDLHPKSLIPDGAAALAMFFGKLVYLINEGPASVAVVGCPANLALLAEFARRVARPKPRRHRPVPEVAEFTDFDLLEVETDETREVDEAVALEVLARDPKAALEGGFGDTLPKHRASVRERLRGIKTDVAGLGRGVVHGVVGLEHGLKDVVLHPGADARELAKIAKELEDDLEHDVRYVADRTVRHHGDFDEVAGGDLGDRGGRDGGDGRKPRLSFLPTFPLGHKERRSADGLTWGDLDDAGGEGSALLGHRDGDDDDDVRVVEEDVSLFTAAGRSPSFDAALEKTLDADGDELDSALRSTLAADEADATPRVGISFDSPAPSPTRGGVFGDGLMTETRVDEDDEGRLAPRDVVLNFGADDDVPAFDGLEAIGPHDGAAALDAADDDAQRDAAQAVFSDDEQTALDVRPPAAAAPGDMTVLTLNPASNLTFDAARGRGGSGELLEGGLEAPLLDHDALAKRDDELEAEL